jgi:oxalate decarboxylase/phosphoglucose isomerase-like protein (cupin superfamily)
MGYIVQGNAHIIILEPNGDNPLYKHKLKRGDVYFIPSRYPHHIKNIGKVDVVICAFYDKSMPGGIPITGSNQWQNLPFDS